MASADLVTEEGEISEAIALPRSFKDNEVDRSGRHRGIYSRASDNQHSRDGSYRRRSRSPRGFKRSYNDRDRHDSRNVRPTYEYGVRDERRNARDVDRPVSRGAYNGDERHNRPVSRGSYNNGNDHRNHNGDDRRNHRFGNGEAQRQQYSQPRHNDRHNRGYNRDKFEDSRPRNRSRSPRERGAAGRWERGRYDSDFHSDSKYSAQVGKPELEHNNTKRHQTDAVERGIDGLAISPPQLAEPDPDVDWEPADEKDKEAEMEAEIQRRRRAREEAYKRGISAVNTPTPSKTEVNTPKSNQCSSPDLTPAELNEAISPESLNLADDQGLAKVNREKIVNHDGPSAADYDPVADMQEDERRDEMRHGNVGLHGEARHTQQGEEAAVVDKKPDPPAKVDDDQDFDMFADEFDEEKFAAVVPRENGANDPGGAHPNGIVGVIDGDDKDGYYKARPGEVINGYRVMENLGRGMFSSVERATEMETGKLVAIKVMRKNDALRKGGITEIAILRKLNDADPDNRRHIVRFEQWFDYKGHLCMVFENLELNLREVVKKYGNNVGINLAAVREYARQIFIGLVHLRKSSIIHADLKPDNILINENRNMLKICDLGTAIDRSDAATASNEVTPYLVSRFYRAPEIILGCPYDYAVDVWSIGCTLYELYTGKILFTGSSNNQMLKNIQEIRGKISLKTLRRSRLVYDHFDDRGSFISREYDKVLDKPVIKTIEAFAQTKTLKNLIEAAVSEDDENVSDFVDLIQKCLTIIPDKRITPLDALKHPFFTNSEETEKMKPHQVTPGTRGNSG